MKKPVSSLFVMTLAFSLIGFPAVSMASTPHGNTTKSHPFVDVVTVISALKGYKPNDRRVALEQQRLTVLGFQNITAKSDPYSLVPSTVVAGKMMIFAKTENKAEAEAAELKQDFLTRMAIVDKGRSLRGFKAVSYTKIPMSSCETFVRSARYFSGYIFVQYVDNTDKVAMPSGRVGQDSCSPTNNVSMYLKVG